MLSKSRAGVKGVESGRASGVFEWDQNWVLPFLLFIDMFVRSFIVFAHTSFIHILAGGGVGSGWLL